jgi:catechol 2,3-dioxygenase-like lactoylglutathione lyase family enzyme
MGVPAINGFGHIDLTVTDIDRSRQWWEEVMGFRLVNVVETPDLSTRSMLHPCGIAVTLVRHSDPATKRFDERAVGLDHFALRVPDRSTLEAWAGHLDAVGVEHSGIQAENGGPLIVFRDPDNIQLEVWAFDPDQVSMNRE